MRIFLTGFMGCGKSFWGRKIAAYLQLPFYDLDECVEEQESISIREIFETKGEDTFRKIEHETLKRIIDSTSEFVLATGGGTPCYFENMQLMNESGMTFYLRTDEQLLCNRLKSEKLTRPLIASLNDTELLSFIHQRLKQRQQFYEQSKHVIDMNGSDETILKRILSNYV